MAKDVRIERVTRPGEGVDRWREMAKKDGKPSIKVGVVSGTGEHPNGSHGQTISEIAWWNEFGTSRIPERPFLRTGLREKVTKYRAILGGGLKKILVGQTDPDTVLGVLGVAAVADVQAKIVAIQSPPNAESTKAEKGSSNPLIDIGALRQWISWEKIEVGP